MGKAAKYLGATARRAGPVTDGWLAEAMQAHLVRGAHVGVFGSTTPWHECLALSAGAGRVTVLEYNRLTYDHPLITTLQPHQLPMDPPAFDLALSISSFQFSGLGRYGDPMDADADLDSMAVAACLLRPGGLLLLAVPIGPDVCVYNLHRRYGRLRLPRLLAGWEVVDALGWSEPSLDDRAADHRKPFKPVLVLRRRPEMASHQEL